MNIVADTNTFIAVALNEPEKETIIRLTGSSNLIAPETLPFEIGNALTALLKKKRLKKQEIVMAWEKIQRIPVELRRIGMEMALDIAAEHHIYAYDAYFLECAVRFHCPLLTLDRGMKQTAKMMNIPIVE